MGVIHKLKPEVLNFILENKKNNPSLSCRELEQLALEKLQVKVSKSSINSIFKENNLSMPIGRRQKEKKKKFNMPTLPVIEGTKAITLVKEPEAVIKPVQEQVADSSLRGAEGDEANTKSEIASGTSCPRNDEEEKRIKEAEEWAMKLQEEERIRIEKKLEIEKEKPQELDDKEKSEEAELKILMDEAFRIKAEKEAKKLQEEKDAQEAAEKKRIEEEKEAKRIEAEKKRIEEAEAKRIEEEKAIQEAAEKAAREAELKAEKERWAKLAEEELKAKQQPTQEEIILQKEEAAVIALPQDRDCSGAILLKALDCLIGASKKINEIICRELGNRPQEFISLTEAVIFRTLFDKDKLSGLWELIGTKYSLEKLDSYYTRIKNIENIKLETDKIISDVFVEARGVKVNFIDGNTIHLDGQLHSAWSSAHIPYDFSDTVYSLKNNLNKYFFQGQPLVLFSAPGYDMPSKDFFSLLLNISLKDKCPDTLTLFGNKLEDIEKIYLNRGNYYSLIFGLWPWQFTASRKVKKIGEFSLKYIDQIDRELYLAEVEIELLRVSLNQSITLKGCAVKVDPKEKIHLVILANDNAPVSLDKLAGAYLSCWPNFEEAFQDFSRKIELFAYVGNTQKFFSKDNFGVDLKKPDLEMGDIFANYIKILDTYLRWRFLPTGYAEKDLSFASEYFYKSAVKLVSGKNRVCAKIQVSKEYQFLKDLEYLCRRLNERQLILANGARIYFETAFK